MAMQTDNGEWLDYCPRHGGVVQENGAKRDEKELYALTRWNQRVKTLSKHEEANSLAAELAILRMMLENRLNFCTDTSSLIIASGSISDMVVKIEKLVRSINFLNKQNTILIDRTAVERLAATLINIVCEFVEDPTMLETICFKFDEALKATTDPSQQANAVNTDRALSPNDSPRSTQAFPEGVHDVDDEESD